MVALMALSAPMVYADNGGGDWHHGQKDQMMAKVLNLTDDQQKQLKDSRQKQKDAMKSIFEQIQSNREAFDAEIVKAAPDMKPSFIAFPGTEYSSKHHYAVFMEGNTALTSKLLMPALVDAETGTLTDMRAMPWYTIALFIAQPLHFGDYGGMPMKILWAALDIATIFVLGSGLYLWLGRRRSSLPARLAELQSGAAEPVST